MGAFIRAKGEKKSAAQQRADLDAAAGVLDSEVKQGDQSGQLIARLLGIGLGGEAGGNVADFANSLIRKDQVRAATSGAAGGSGAAAGLLNGAGVGNVFRDQAERQGNTTLQGLLAHLAGQQARGTDAKNTQADIISRKRNANGALATNAGNTVIAVAKAIGNLYTGGALGAASAAGKAGKGAASAAGSAGRIRGPT